MKNLLSISLILFFLLCTWKSLGQKSLRTEKIIRQLEETRRQASLNGDTRQLAKIFAPEFYEIGKTGKFRTRKQNFQERGKGILHFDSLSFDSIQVKVIGDVAIVTGIVNGRGLYADQPFEQTMLRYSRVYLYRRGAWQIIFGQNTPIVNN